MAESAAVVGASPAATLQPLRVLVADDGRSTADILAIFFELEGHQVQIAYDGEEALAFAKERMPQLILMDLSMPRMDGLEASRRIRREPGGRDPVIIALSGFDLDTDTTGCREADIDGHLAKPASPEDLREIIRRFGDRFSSREEAGSHPAAGCGD